MNAIRFILLSLLLILCSAPASAAPPYPGVQNQLSNTDCVPTAFANAAHLSIAAMREAVNILYLTGGLDNVESLREMYPNGYPFDLTPLTTRNAILTLESLGYTVRVTQATPQEIANAPQLSVIGWRSHVWNKAWYANGVLRLHDLDGEIQEFNLADMAVLRYAPTNFVATGDSAGEQAPGEIAYPDLYIVSRGRRVVPHIEQSEPPPVVLQRSSKQEQRLTIR